MDRPIARAPPAVASPVAGCGYGGGAVPSHRDASGLYRRRPTGDTQELRAPSEGRHGHRVRR